MMTFKGNPPLGPPAPVVGDQWLTEKGLFILMKEGWARVGEVEVKPDVVVGRMAQVGSEDA